MKNWKQYFEQRTKLNPESGCLEWTLSTGNGGYGNMHCDGKNGQLSHRIAWLKLVGPIPEGLSVLHNCDNPRCCNVEHLRLGTTQENQQEKARKGRAGKFLTPELVRELLNEHAAGATGVALCAKYGVSTATISGIINGRTWRHVE